MLYPAHSRVGSYSFTFITSFITIIYILLLMLKHTIKACGKVLIVNSQLGIKIYSLRFQSRPIDDCKWRQCGFDSHSSNEIFSISSLWLSSATQHTMPPEFSRKWGAECPSIRSPLPILLYAGYSVKLKILLILAPKIQVLFVYK